MTQPIGVILIGGVGFRVKGFRAFSVIYRVLGCIWVICGLCWEYWGYIGIISNKMETTILGYIGFWVYGVRLRVPRLSSKSRV